MLNLNPDIYHPDKLTAITNLLSINISLALIISGVFLLLIHPLRRSLLPLLIPVLIFDLWFFATGNLFTAPREAISIPSLPINPGTDRILSSTDVFAYTGLHVYWNHLRVRQPFAPDLSHSELQTYSRLRHQLKLFPSNLNILPQWSSASGYSAVVLKSYADYWQSSLINSVHIPDLEDFRLRELGVNYFITDPALDPPSAAGFAPIPNQPHIMSRLQPSSRVRLVSGHGSAKLVSHQPNHITLSVSTPQSDSLIIMDSFYPGWRADINGQPVDITVFNHAFRQVPIPPGDHTVTFSYHPNSVKIGAIISALSLIFIILIASWPNQRLLSSFLTGTASKTP